jgi:hypothetical protein
MPIELDCRTCKQPFTPTTEALRKGPPHWWYCPACRPNGESMASENRVAAVQRQSHQGEALSPPHGGHMASEHGASERRPAACPVCG